MLAASVHGAIGVRAIASEWTPLKGKSALDVLMWGFGIAARGAGPARGRGGGAVTTRRHPHTTGTRRNALWIAAMVHRISGLALACFLPLHFLALGLAIDGEARLDGFLRWTAKPLVKLGETVLVFLLAVHMLGGIRVLRDRKHALARGPEAARDGAPWSLPRLQALAFLARAV